MAKPYSITITNGEGTAPILNGEYSVTASANGYNNSSIDPSTLTIVEGTNEYSFTIEATGTLTLHVSEEGTSGGTPVVGAKFIRCDSFGNTYGSEITTEASGNAVFQYVPFASSDAPTVYYKQTSSDGNHEFSDELRSINLTESTGLVEIQNAAAVSRTIKLTDKNYDGLDIGSATITLN